MRLCVALDCGCSSLVIWRKCRLFLVVLPVLVLVFTLVLILSTSLIVSLMKEPTVIATIPSQY